jgi:hydroxymethylglutaryl-CoA synthase
VRVGVVAYGAYVPWWRLDRATIAPAPGRGTRAVASYDEDATSMGVEAARLALASAPADAGPQAVYFATTAPPYLDKTNATAIHAALDLSPSVMAVDMIGSVRSAAGAWRASIDAAASGRAAVAVLGDVRTGLPGSADERDGGDGAAALVFGAGESVIAEVLGAGSATAEFLDRWRVPGESASKVWEERFGEHAYVPLAEAAVADACKDAGIAPDAVHHAIVTGTHSRAVRRVARSIGVRPETVAPDLTAEVGHTGVAHAALLLADVLDRAEPDRPAAPPSFRREAWKFAFVGSRCQACGTCQLPPQRVCVGCHAVDDMVRQPLADVRATVATFTVDHLAYSMSPPVVAAVVDFDGGGRYQCEITDVDPDTVAIGDRMEMTFRRLYSADGVHDYFWKARPVRDDERSQ